MFTVGSLNADILRYNADNLSITLKLWGKLDDNVSWVNTFPSQSSISLHFTRQNIAYRVTTVPMLATARILSTHIVLSRGNGCHKRATTLILWGLRQFWGNFRFQPGQAVFMTYLCVNCDLFPFCVYRNYSFVFILLQELNFCCRWTQHWKCEVRFSLSLSFAGEIP